MRLPSTGFTYYLNYTIHINHRINFSQFDGAEYSVSSWEPGQDLEQESLIKTEDWEIWKSKEVNDLPSTSIYHGIFYQMAHWQYAKLFIHDYYVECLYSYEYSNTL